MTNDNRLAQTLILAIGLSWLALLGAPLEAAEAPEIARRRRMQQEAAEVARQLIADVLDVQIGQFAENGLVALPVFGDIRKMRANLNNVTEDDMQGIIALLGEAQHAAADSRGPLLQQARGKAREVIIVLMAERERLRRRLKVAHLNAQLVQLIEEQARVRAETRALNEVAEDRRDARTLETLEDQRDTQTLYDQLLESLDTISTWETEEGTIAGESKEQLSARDVDGHLDRAELELTAGRFVDAAQAQTAVLRELRKVLERLRAAQGLRRFERSSTLETVRQLVSAQKKLNQDTQEVDDEGQDRFDDLSTRQHKVAERIGGLKASNFEDSNAREALEEAEQTALQAENELFEGRKDAAVENQEAVVRHLRRLVESLEQMEMEAGIEGGEDYEAMQIEQLEELDEALEELQRQQDEVIENARPAPTRAEQLQRDVARDVAEQARRKPLDESVQQQVESAARTSERAAEKMADHSSDAGRTREDAAQDAKKAIQAAQAEARAKLQQMRGRQQGAGDQRLAQSSGEPGQGNPSGRSTRKESRESQESTRDARRDGRRNSSLTDTAPKRAVASERRVGDGRLEREGREDIPGRSFIDAPWFARLPVEVREAIRVRVRRRPPRGYEDRLRRYFESVDR